MSASTRPRRKTTEQMKQGGASQQGGRILSPEMYTLFPKFTDQMEAEVLSSNKRQEEHEKEQEESRRAKAEEERKAADQKQRSQDVSRELQRTKQQRITSRLQKSNPSPCGLPVIQGHHHEEAQQTPVEVQRDSLQHGQQQQTGKRKRGGSTPRASTPSTISSATVVGVQKEQVGDVGGDVGVEGNVGVGAGEGRGVRNEGAGADRRQTGASMRGNEMEKGDAQDRAEVVDDKDDRLPLSVWREAVKSAPMHPSDLSSGESISVGGSDYKVTNVLKTNMEIRVKRSDNDNVEKFGFDELILNPTFSTDSRRRDGWGECDIHVGTSTFLAMSILHFTRICLWSGLNIDPSCFGVTGKSISMIECLECLNTEYVTQKGCSKEKTLTALLTSKLKDEKNARDSNLVTNFKKLILRALPVWLRVAALLRSKNRLSSVQDAQKSTRLVDVSAQERASKDLSRVVGDVEKAGGQIIVVVALDNLDTLKVLASRKWGATSAGDALPLSAMASNLTTGHGRSSEAPRYPRELLLELAHAQSGVWDQEQVRSDTEFLFLPKSEHFSQKQPTMFQFHFIQETDKLLQDSYPTKCKKEGLSMNFYHARESFVGYFADSALYPGLVFSILARQGIPGVGFEIDSKSMECMMEIIYPSNGSTLHQSDMPWHRLVLGCLSPSCKSFEKCAMRIYQSDLSGGFGAPSQSQMNLRHSVNRDAVASTFGRLVGMLRIEGGDSGELDAASLQESSDNPRLAVITHFERDCALGVMEAIGVHAPKAGAIGKSMEVLVMEKGSVVRPHIEMCEGGPCTVTYLAVFGNLRILSWGCDTKTQIWGMSDSEINFLSTSPSTLDFNQSNPHFRPLLYQALTNQAVAIRDGCFHLLVASTDAVILKFKSWNLGDVLHVHDVCDSLRSSKTRSHLLESSFLVRFVTAVSDSSNGSLSGAIKAPLQSIRIQIPRGFYVDVCLGLRKSWPFLWPADRVHQDGGETQISTSDGNRVQHVVFVCAEPPVGFRGEIVVLVSEFATRENGRQNFLSGLQSTDGSCTWPDSGGSNISNSLLIEISWESLGAGACKQMAKEGGEGKGETGERRGEEMRGGDGQVQPGGDGVWTCIGCDSDGPALVKHKCGCRACYNCFFGKEGGENVGCGETRCANNVAKVGCRVECGQVVVLPDAGRGREIWEQQGHVWGSAEFEPFVCNDSSLLVRIKSSTEPPRKAWQTLLGKRTL